MHPTIRRAIADHQIEDALAATISGTRRGQSRLESEAR